jgi:hypothetical protein
MKQTRNFKAAVAIGSFAAAVALLSGLPSASAQQTTAPGGGSVPGSFLVPGTNTSIYFHGIIWAESTDFIGPHEGDTTLGVTGLPLHGYGIKSGESAGYSVNGGWELNLKGTRFILGTSTPTAFGELKTYLEADFNQFAGGQVTGVNADTFRLRQAYGTLGPWLFGQTYSNYVDLLSWPDADGLDASVGAGIPMVTITGRLPQIRYTYLAGNGLTLAGSVEMPITYYNLETCSSVGPCTSVGVAGNSNNQAAPVTTGSGSVLQVAASTGGVQDIPAFVGTGEWDQPWGHIKLGAVLQDLQIRNQPAVSNGNDISKLGYGLSASGHLNTWGKDRLGGGANYTHGAFQYGPGYLDAGSTGGIVMESPLASNLATSTCTGTGAAGVLGGVPGQLDGCATSLANAYGLYVNYLHYWTDVLRTNADIGYEHTSRPGATDNWTLAQLSSLENLSYATHLNLIWSPVPGAISLTAEWDYYRRVMFGSAWGNTNMWGLQAKFFW